MQGFLHNKFKDTQRDNNKDTQSLNVYKYKNKDIHELRVGGTNVVKAIYDLLYKDATVFLERKYIKFKEYYEN